MKEEYKSPYNLAPKPSLMQRVYEFADLHGGNPDERSLLPLDASKNQFRTSTDSMHQGKVASVTQARKRPIHTVLDALRFSGTRVDEGSILKLHHPEAEYLKNLGLDELEKAVRAQETILPDGRIKTLEELKVGIRSHELLTENGKVIAAIRFLYEDPKRIAAFGDDATHVVAAIKQIAKTSPRKYSKLLKEAGIALIHGSVHAVAEEIQKLEKLDASTPGRLMDSLCSWEHVRSNLGVLSNIPDGIAVSLDENTRGFRDALEAPTRVGKVQGFCDGVVRKRKEISTGYSIKPEIPPNYMADLRASPEFREEVAHLGESFGSGAFVHSVGLGVRTTVAETVKFLTKKYPQHAERIVTEFEGKGVLGLVYNIFSRGR